MVIYEAPPEPVLEWVMLFPNGRPASAVLRSSDMEEVRGWAKAWPGTLRLHRRIVLEGHWIEATDAVEVDLSGNKHQRPGIRRGRDVA